MSAVPTPTLPPAQAAAQSALTWDQAEWQSRSGQMDSLTWRWYVFFWTWCAPRFSNVANASHKQERAFERLGVEAYQRRIDRVNRLRIRLATPILVQRQAE